MKNEKEVEIPKLFYVMIIVRFKRHHHQNVRAQAAQCENDVEKYIYLYKMYVRKYKCLYASALAHTRDEMR